MYKQNKICFENSSVEYSSLALTKFLYAGDDLFIEMECRGADAMDGAKYAPEDSSFYVWARAFVSSENLIAVAQKKLDLRTYGCYVVTLVGTQETVRFIIFVFDTYLCNAGIVILVLFR